MRDWVEFVLFAAVLAAIAAGLIGAWRSHYRKDNR